MATAAAARALSRSTFRASPAPLRTTASRTFTPRIQQSLRQQSRRGYADAAPGGGAAPKKGGYGSLIAIFALGAAAGVGYYSYAGSDAVKDAAASVKGAAVPFTPKFEDYEKVYTAIAKLLEERDEYEDGSYGPVLLRLAWHASGTYDAETKTGGSNGATMRFQPERDHGANAGLTTAQTFLEPVKKQFPWLSYGDLWTLAGVAAIQEMQGPQIPWRPGREDKEEAFCTPDGRLPDASKGESHLRAIFGRMGFNDQELVALSGAHALGRCHTDRSGFEGPWTFSPTVLTNDYYKLLVDEKWLWRKWNGPKQYEDKSTKSIMMLPTDMALVQDKKLRPFVEKYAKDNEAFFTDFSNVIAKLFELGVPFKTDEKWRFKPLASSA